MSDPVCTRMLFESRSLPSPCRCPRCADEKEESKRRQGPGAKLPDLKKGIPPLVERGRMLARVLRFLKSSKNSVRRYFRNE